MCSSGTLHPADVTLPLYLLVARYSSIAVPGCVLAVSCIPVDVTLPLCLLAAGYCSIPAFQSYQTSLGTSHG